MKTQNGIKGSKLRVLLFLIFVASQQSGLYADLSIAPDAKQGQAISPEKGAAQTVVAVQLKQDGSSATKDFLAGETLSKVEMESAVRRPPDPCGSKCSQETVPAESNSRFEFLKVQEKAKLQVYLVDKTTKKKTLVLELKNGQGVQALDVDPSGRYALINVTGENLDKGGYLVVFDIQKKEKANPVSAFSGAKAGILSGVVFDNCNCTSRTPYRFESGLILVNLKEPDDSVYPGYAKNKGIVFNLTETVLRYTETVPISFGEKYLMTPQKDKLVFARAGVDPWIVIYDLKSGTMTLPAHSYGFGGIKAISPDGEFVIVATNQQTIVAVSVRNRQIPDRLVFVTVPQGQPVSSFRLQSLQFLTATLAEGKLVNGETVRLYVDAGKFYILQPEREVVAPNNTNFSFVTVFTETGQDLYLKDKNSGKRFLLAKLVPGESVPSFDVDPSGKYAMFNIVGPAYLQGGVTKILNIAKSEVVQSFPGVLYAAEAFHRKSAFQFVDGLVIVSFHSGGYRAPTGGVVLNLSGVPVRVTQTGFINIADPMLLTPQIDKLVFGGSLGVGIYDVASGRIDYKASQGNMIRAISPDGEFAMVGSGENIIYVVSIRDLSRPVRSLTVPLPCSGYACYSGRGAYALVTASFVSANIVDGILANGQRIRIYVDAVRFEIIPA